MPLLLFIYTTKTLYKMTTSTDKKQNAIDLTEFGRQLDRRINTLAKQDLTNAKYAEDKITEMLQLLPSGSGLDAGVQFNWNESKPNRLVFSFGYHHMSEGSYTGWTKHKLIITPSFVNAFDMRITGRDKNNVKDYLYQVFEAAFWF